MSDRARDRPVPPFARVCTSRANTDERDGRRDEHRVAARLCVSVSDWMISRRGNHHATAKSSAECDRHTYLPHERYRAKLTAQRPLLHHPEA